MFAWEFKSVSKLKCHDDNTSVKVIKRNPV